MPTLEIVITCGENAGFQTFQAVVLQTVGGKTITFILYYFHTSYVVLLNLSIFIHHM